MNGSSVVESIEHGMKLVFWLIVGTLATFTLRYFQFEYALFIVNIPTLLSIVAK